MSSIWGKDLQISIFGESHSKAVGVTLSGLPTGFLIDMPKVLDFMKRRSPGRDSYSTARKEEDLPDILCGIFDNKTTGAPLTAVIYNKDTKSKDYHNISYLPRPSHADYTGHIKYAGFNDKRGGGHFSGRLTVGLVFAGAVCAQILEKKGIYCGAHILSIKDIEDKPFDLCDIDENLLKEISKKDFPVIEDNKAQKMKEIIMDAKSKGDSVGGVVECAVIGLLAGIGEPMFDGVENKIASILFGIPAVKGVQFGKGFDITKLYGSQANDELYLYRGKIRTYSNNNGGVNGGITNGMPVVFNVAIKPTPSIAKEQRTVNLDTMQESKVVIQGRHDPCIVKRALPVVEAAANIALLDMIMGEKK